MGSVLLVFVVAGPGFVGSVLVVFSVAGPGFVGSLLLQSLYLVLDLLVLSW